MSRYADLRWKIADLEKELEAEKTYSRKLLKDMERYILMIYQKDKDIEMMKCALEKMHTKDGADNG